MVIQIIDRTPKKIEAPKPEPEERLERLEVTFNNETISRIEIRIPTDGTSGNYIMYWRTEISQADGIGLLRNTVRKLGQKYIVEPEREGERDEHLYQEETPGMLVIPNSRYSLEAFLKNPRRIAAELRLARVNTSIGNFILNFNQSRPSRDSAAIESSYNLAGIITGFFLGTSIDLHESNRDEVLRIYQELLRKYPLPIKISSIDGINRF